MKQFMALSKMVDKKFYNTVITQNMSYKDYEEKAETNEDVRGVKEKIMNNFRKTFQRFQERYGEGSNNAQSNKSARTVHTQNYFENIDNIENLNFYQSKEDE